MAAGISGKLFPNFSYPLDLRRTFRGKRMFGDHKTIRGIVLGTAAGTIFYLLQSTQVSKFDLTYTVNNQDPINSILIGLSLSMGGLIGDVVKSFFKRQLEIRPGKSWFPFDQLDWVCGTIIFSLWFIDLDIAFILLTFVTGLALHMSIKLAGYLLKLQDEKF